MFNLYRNISAPEGMILYYKLTEMREDARGKYEKELEVLVSADITLSLS